MSKPEPRLSRGQWRVWLKWVLQSGLLDRLPPRYEAEGASNVSTPEEVARELLTRLQDAELRGLSLAPVMIELQLFRSWVESRQKRTRQLILAEHASANVARNWLENWAEAMISEPSAAPPSLSPRGVMPRFDPMWDENLDG